jgi:hypothetical protein
MIPEEVLINILTYSQEYNTLFVSKKFNRLSMITYKFDVELLYDDCSTGHDKYIKLYLEDNLKTNEVLNIEKCMCLSIKNKYYDIIKILNDNCELQNYMLNLCLISSRKIVELLMDKIKNLYQINYFKIIKLGIKTNSYSHDIKLRSNFMILTIEHTQDEFENIVKKIYAHISLRDSDKKFLIEARKCNVEFISDYIKTSKKFGNFIPQCIIRCCMRYFNWISNTQIFDLLKCKLEDQDFTCDNIKLDIVNNIKMSKCNFNKAFKYESIKIIKSFIEKDKNLVKQWLLNSEQN